MSSNANPEQQICVVGSANVDLTFRTSRLPVPGETLAGQSLHRYMGGKGANQAGAAARLGALTTQQIVIIFAAFTKKVYPLRHS